MLRVCGVSSLVCAAFGRARLLSLSVRRPFEVHFPTSDRRDLLRTRCASKDMLKMPRFRRRALGRSALLLAAPLLVLLGSTTSVAAQCEHFAPFGQPVHRSLAADVGVLAPPEWTVICHTGQVVAFNSTHNVSDWAAYRLRREDLLNDVVKRKDAFRGDPEVPEGHRVVKADYTGTGYDRGHLAPAGRDEVVRRVVMSESFFMSNMAPQVGNGFNRHIWKSLEQRMRRWACERGVLYVVTGPLYERATHRAACLRQGWGWRRRQRRARGRALALLQARLRSDTGGGDCLPSPE